MLFHTWCGRIDVDKYLLFGKSWLCDAHMSKKVLNIDWQSIQGAAVRKRILKLSKNEEGIVTCPVTTCLHLGFKSDRGARKHINTMHPWYLYFDQQPLINKSEYQTKANRLSRKKIRLLPRQLASTQIQWS